MTITSLRKFLLPLFVLFIAYVAWSQFQIFQLSKKLSVEEQRVFNIARNLELWKTITVKDKGYFDVKRLSSEEQGFNIKQIDRDNSGIGKNEKLFIIYYTSPPNKNELKRYTSDLILNDYLSVVTDTDLKIKSMTWDKP